MKQTVIYISLCLICTVFLVGCQSTITSLKREYPSKVVTPQAPYVDENIEVIDQRASLTVDRSAKVTANAAKIPVRFWDKLTKGVKGVSDANPYERQAPYYRQDFKKEMLAEEMQYVTQPKYLRGERYAKAYRSPFIFKEELERGGTSEMSTVSEVGTSLMAKQYLSFQEELEGDLDEAEKLYDEKKYSQALELVDKVLDLDLSSQRGRILFEKIIKAREADKVKQEQEARERIAMNEKISQYISESRQYFNDHDYDEALRIAKKALSVDPEHKGAREMVDAIELAQFEDGLKESGTSSLEILERMIYQHLTLYKQYSSEHLDDLAKKELQKVSILESYRDKISGLQEALK